MKVALVYWSNTGNTQKVANAIRQGLIKEEVDLSFWKIDEAEQHSFLDYDLYSIGFPSYSWHPPKPVTKYLKEHHRKNVKAGLVKLSSPRVHGTHALVFCTYSGPHTGLDEAIPAVKYAEQFFEHIGISVVAEWCVLSEFIGNERASTQGRMGDIRGKPTEEKLEKIKKDTIKLVKSLKNR
jgi:flavorubredoxin